MHRDDATLPERYAALLRAGYARDGASAARIAQGLSDEDPRARVLALRSARRRGLLDANAWVVALADASVEVRREAVNLVAVSAIDDARVGDAIVTALGDDDALVVEGAAFAAGEHALSGGVDALDVVARTHDDARCRESAVAALGAIGDDRGRMAVITALDDKPPVRRRAIVALSNFEGPDVDAALERAREDRDWQVRAAVEQLTRDEVE